MEPIEYIKCMENVITMLFTAVKHRQFLRFYIFVAL